MTGTGNDEDLTIAWKRVVGLVVAGVLAGGAIVRVADLVRARSLWADEAMLALNVVGHGPLEILGHVDLLQVAPPLFITLQQLSAALLGVNEPAMRLVPMLAGLLASVFSWPVARRVVGRPAAVIVVGLVALSATLVAYSNEAKPYTVDAMASVLLLLLTLRAGEQPQSLARATALALFLALGPLLSFPVAFVGAGSVLAMTLLMLGGRLVFRRVLVFAVAWVAGSLVSLAMQQDPATKAAMAVYWQGSFFDFGDLRFAWAFWRDLAFTALVGGARLTTADVIERSSGLIGLVLSAIGAVSLYRRDRGMLAVVIAPLGAALVTSAIGYYPLSLRLWLWAAPLVMLLLVAGIRSVANRLPVKAPVFLLAIAALLVFPSARRDIYYLRHPVIGPEDAKAVVAALSERRTREDALYVPARSASAWLFYTFPWSEADPDQSAWLHEYLALASPGGPSFIAGPAPATLDAEQDRLLRSAPPEDAILGVASGHMIAPRRGSIADPDPNWTRIDLRRIRSTGKRCTWVFNSHVMGPERAALAKAFEAIGIIPVDSIKARGASAIRYC